MDVIHLEDEKVKLEAEQERLNEVTAKTLPDPESTLASHRSNS